MNKPPSLDLTQPLPKYVAVLVLQNVYCDNCHCILAPNGISHGLDVPQIETIAEKLHQDGVRSKAILCATPKLLISYGQARLCAELVK